MWTERQDESFTGWGDAIGYPRLEGGVWSQPIDVLRNPSSWDFSVRPPAITAANGRLHVVWSSSTDLYYSSAPLDTALSSKDWTKPVSIAGGNGGPSIVADSQGVLHVTTLDSSGADPGIYYTRSADNGSSWSDPVRLSSSAPTAQPLASQAFSTYMLVDEDDNLHVAWTDRYRPGLYYVQSQDGGNTWSEPFLIDAPDNAEDTRDITWPSIGKSGDGLLHLIWQAGHETKNESCARYQRVSTDKGLTWNPRERILSRFMGCLGWNMMLNDSSGTLHMLSIGRDALSGATIETRPFHMVWTGATWSEPEWIAGVSSPNDTWDAKGIDEPQLAISEGNRLHAVYVTRDRRVWYTSKTTAAPHIAPQSIPASNAIAAVPAATAAPAVAEKSAENTTQEVAAPSANVQLASGSKAAAPQSSKTLAPIVVGILPAVLLVLAVMLIFLRRRGRR